MNFNTLYEILHSSVEKYSDKVAFSMLGSEEVTYSELGRRVKEVQDMLLGAGLNASDKVVNILFLDELSAAPQSEQAQQKPLAMGSAAFLRDAALSNRPQRA